MNTGIACGQARKWISILRLLFLTLAMLVSGMNHAMNGRDFAGFYTATETANLGSQKQIKLTLRVFNYSDANVAGDMIVLEDPLQIGKTLCSIPGVTIPVQGNTLLSADQIVPAQEFMRWQAGDQMRQPIELASMLLGVQP